MQNSDKTIKCTKISNFNKQIINSTSRMKTAKNIVKYMTGRKSRQEEIHTLNINDEGSSNKLYQIPSMNVSHLLRK
jgi:hypothetical protein